MERWQSLKIAKGRAFKVEGRAGLYHAHRATDEDGSDYWVLTFKHKDVPPTEIARLGEYGTLDECKYAAGNHDKKFEKE